MLRFEAFPVFAGIGGQKRRQKRLKRPPGHQAVGLDINANHLKGVKSGWVTGTARPVHLGRTTQVWQIDLRNDAGELSCVSRITMAILAPR